jgi:hypothetical protein
MDPIDIAEMQHGVVRTAQLSQLTADGRRRL